MVKTRGMILIVDDNDLSLEMVISILKKEGYGYDMTGDSDEAIKKASRSFYDLILLDLLMPGKSGLEIAKAIRQSGQISPIVALTGGLLQTTVEEIKNSGINELVMKPIGYQELKNLISRYIPNGG